MTKTAAGRRWLSGCLLRVFTEADYLIRWRRLFALRMGFSRIPGDGDEGVVSTKPRQARAIESAQDLDQWMRSVGLTDQELATRLGLSRSYVSGQRSGRRPWSSTFQQKVMAVVERSPGKEAENEGENLVPKVTSNGAEGTKYSLQMVPREPKTHFNEERSHDRELQANPEFQRLCITRWPARQGHYEVYNEVPRGVATPKVVAPPLVITQGWLVDR
jgi:hypothetical protein